MISLEPNFTSYSLSLKKNETNCAKASSNSLVVSGSESKMPSASNLKAYYLPSPRKNIAFSGATATKINQAIKLGASKDTTIPQRYDGGYLVDRETNTIAIDGEYEHLCFQTPSAFQYGFSYKTNLSPFSNNFTDEAIDKLKDSHDEL